MTARESPATSAAFLTQSQSAVYVELTKPRIALMVSLTVAAGFLMAPNQPFSSFGMLHAVVGCFLSCCGAGALNQYMERESDGVMARTRFRPIPAHRVSPVTGLLIGFLLTVSGVVYLASMVNALSAALDSLTVLVYLCVYTPLKRISPLSTLIGAVPGALPPVIGWAAATGSLGPGAWVLFAIVFLWQIPHFLAIGRMYREDYERGGFPMLVVIDTDGSATSRQTVLYAATLVPVSIMTGPLALSGTPYCFAALVLGLSYLGFSVAAARRPTLESARKLLLCSIVYLPLLLASMLLDRLFS